MADKYPHPYLSFGEKVFHVRNTQAVSMQKATEIVRREDFDERIRRADTLYELQQVLAEMLPYLKFREES